MASLTKSAKFMDNNLASFASAIFSSDSSGFENLYDENLSKAWAPNGTWWIDGRNDRIYVNDGGPITVFLTHGAYTRSQLLVEIETQLEAQTSETWTVTAVGTAFRIRLDGTAATLELSKRTSAIWDDIGFTSIIDEPLVTTELVTGIGVYHGQEYIEVDFGNNANEISFMSLIGKHNKVFSLTSNAVVTVKMDNNTSNWDNPAVSQLVEVTPRGLFYFFDLPDCRYRYLRLEIVDRSNSTLEFSYFYAGNYLEINRNITIGYQKERIDPTDVQETESGRRYFNIKDRYERWDGMVIEYPTRSDRLKIEQMWHDFGRFKPFFISIDPTTNISNDLSELTRFVYFNSDVNYDHNIRDLYSINFTVRDVI